MFESLFQYLYLFCLMCSPFELSLLLFLLLRLCFLFLFIDLHNVGRDKTVSFAETAEIALPAIFSQSRASYLLQLSYFQGHPHGVVHFNYSRVCSHQYITTFPRKRSKSTNSHKLLHDSIFPFSINIILYSEMDNLLHLFSSSAAERALERLRAIKLHCDDYTDFKEVETLIKKKVRSES